jgi:hypothetical protein
LKVPKSFGLDELAELDDAELEAACDAMAGEVPAVVGSISPILAGKHPMVQSAALADLVAMWLAGMFIVGDDEATALLRESSLEHFVETVQRLIPVNEKVTKPMLAKRLKEMARPDA